MTSEEYVRCSRIFQFNSNNVFLVVSATCGLALSWSMMILSWFTAIWRRFSSWLGSNAIIVDCSDVLWLFALVVITHSKALSLSHRCTENLMIVDVVFCCEYQWLTGINSWHFMSRIVKIDPLFVHFHNYLSRKLFFFSCTWQAMRDKW